MCLVHFNFLEAFLSSGGMLKFPGKSCRSGAGVSVSALLAFT